MIRFCSTIESAQSTREVGEICNIHGWHSQVDQQYLRGAQFAHPLSQCNEDAQPSRTFVGVPCYASICLCACFARIDEALTSIDSFQGAINSTQDVV